LLIASAITSTERRQVGIALRTIEEQVMDLTREYPTSVKTPLHGIVQLARTIDKGKAAAAGTLGEYSYNCPMDAAVFEFLGIDHEALLAVIRSANSERDITDYVAPFVARKPVAQIHEWNAMWLGRGPEPGSDSETYFLTMRAQVAPDRTDVATWSDLLDLDEKRDVPRVARV